MFHQALILAGGEGKRLRPLTYTIPKPLLPVGDKPIIEDIIIKLRNSGVNNIYISVNYKKEMIINYLKDGKLLGVHINYIVEDKPTGTAGSLLLIPSDEDTIVINGDILSDVDFRKMYEFMIKNSFDFILTGVKQTNYIDFGVIYFNKKYELTHWEEKPRYEYFLNAGIYGIKSHVIRFLKKNLPKGEHNMPNIWNILKKNGYKVGVYIHEGLWKDVGRVSDYFEIIRGE